MADFNVRSDSVNVELIMEQIRTRIREKRGVDYTEQQIRELAAVKLEKFLDPRGVRSDLLDQFRKAQPAYEPPELPNYEFGEATLFESHRGFIRWLRKLLMPILKLFFNPNPLIDVLHKQSKMNDSFLHSEALYYELIHNLVLETTRMGIEVKNLKMRVESMSSRLDFDERRARALEGVVQYRPGAVPPLQPPAGPNAATNAQGPATEAESAERRARRRRRRGRRRPDQRGPEGQAMASGPDGPDDHGDSGPAESFEPAGRAADDPHES